MDAKKIRNFTWISECRFRISESFYSAIRNPQSTIHKFMKKILLSCLTICALFHTANAQLTEKQLKSHQKDIAKSKEKGSVIWSFDTLFNKGAPYCILKKKKQTIFGYSEADFYALNGKNAFYAKMLEIPGTFAYELTFLASGKQGYLDVRLEKGVVEAELFAGDSLNEAAVTKFLMVHSERPKNKLAKVGIGTRGNDPINTTEDDDSPSSAQPMRNRQAPVLIFGSEAQQDFKKIGSIKQVFGVVSSNLLYEIFDASGRKIAEAEGKMHSTSWQVVTLKNNKAHSVSCAPFKEKEAIMEYLTQLRYL
jgi:hypothetical protein